MLQKMAAKQAAEPGILSNPVFKLTQKAAESGLLFFFGLNCKGPKTANAAFLRAAFAFYDD